LTAQNFSGANFWAARALMRAGQPQQVVALLSRAAVERTTFYGALAARILGHDIGDSMSEATVDPQRFAALMNLPSAHRAIALWQIGRRDAVEAELGRAFSEMPADLDVSFAAVARLLGYPTLEMRAAEDAAHNGVYLTSLYPVPNYQPAQGYTLDPALVLAFARQESRFDAEALSHSGARGIMQLMPNTAALVAGDKSLAGNNADRLNDPAYNMQLGQDYLKRLLSDQNNSLFALAAAYNSGPGNLQRWMAASDNNDDSLLFVESIPNAETRIYVKRVMMNLWMYRKRLNEPPDGLDETASGQWPFYASGKPTVTAQTADAAAPTESN
jgi:soluble lytic murein transglycosylase-like protein